MNVRRTVKSCRRFIGMLVAVTCLPTTELKPDEPANTTRPVADAMLGTEAGQVRDDSRLKMKLVWCPPGTFIMGSPNADRDHRPNENQVEVTLTNGFWLGKYEVTQSEWSQVTSTEPWKGQTATKEGDDFPATYVNWEDAMGFCRKLTEAERKAGRIPEGWEYTLPTEAQWEYASRAKTQTKFNFGDDRSKIGEYAWVFETAVLAGEQYAHRVGQKKPNAWGLYDIYGNVSEWCRDLYAEKLPGGRDPEVTEKGSYRVPRGGHWYTGPRNSPSAFREGEKPLDRSSYLGFRVALSRSGKN